jgi:hypothetical protein
LTLVNSEKPLTDDSVHEIRKSLKRARAALRLVRDAVTGSEYQHENALLRDAARLLAPARDATVLLTVGRRLTDSEEAKRDRGPVLRVLSAAHEDKSRLRREMQKAVPTEIASLGLERVYRKARKAAKLARAEKSDRALHEARKEGKYLANALKIVQPRNRRLAKVGKRADVVAKRLGDDRDLAVFSSKLPKNAQTIGLRAKIARMRRELQKGILHRTKKLYKAKPKAFAERATR